MGASKRRMLTTALGVAAVVVPLVATAGGAPSLVSAAKVGRDGPRPAAALTTRPMKHLVASFDENVSFDRSLGTYPTAVNPPGEPALRAAPGRP